MFSKNYTNSGIRCQAANRPFLVFDFPNSGTLAKSVLVARVPESQELNMVG